jgi:flavin-dependent dehydrogenase
MKNNPRTLVVGAGPAGTATALALLQSGMEVTIMDHAAFPRHRPGETLPPAIEPLLKKLNASDVLHALPYLRHSGHWVKWGRGEKQFVPFQSEAAANASGTWTGVQAPRAQWDQQLLALAISRGAEFIQRTPPEISRDTSRRILIADRHFSADDFIVDCSGSSRWLQRQLAIPLRQISRNLVAQYGYATGDATAELPLIRTEGQGWTWLAEISPRRFQWTHVAPHESAPAREWRPRELAALSVERRFGADVTWRLLAETAGRRWFVAGDAAAILDPSSGHGILRAMMSGMMAAHLIAAVAQKQIADTTAAPLYHRWLESWFHQDAAAMRKHYLDGGLPDPLLRGTHGSHADYGVSHAAAPFAHH